MYNASSWAGRRRKQRAQLTKYVLSRAQRGVVRRALHSVPDMWKGANVVRAYAVDIVLVLRLPFSSAHCRLLLLFAVGVVTQIRN